jgi:hypothetical protein
MKMCLLEIAGVVHRHPPGAVEIIIERGAFTLIHAVLACSLHEVVAALVASSEPTVPELRVPSMAVGFAPTESAASSPEWEFNGRQFASRELSLSESISDHS